MRPAAEIVSDSFELVYLSVCVNNQLKRKPTVTSLQTGHGSWYQSCINYSTSKYQYKYQYWVNS